MIQGCSWHESNARFSVIFLESIKNRLVIKIFSDLKTSRQYCSFPFVILIADDIGDSPVWPFLHSRHDPISSDILIGGLLKLLNFPKIQTDHQFGDQERKPEMMQFGRKRERVMEVVWCLFFYECSRIFCVRREHSSRKHACKHNKY